MGEYKKITKDDIDFPRYCLYFIKQIQSAIDGNNYDSKNFLEIVIDSTYQYCSDAFDLIVKTFENKGYNVMTPTFKMTYISGVKHYSYRWKIKKYSLDDIDNLPF